MWAPGGISPGFSLCVLGLMPEIAHSIVAAYDLLWVGVRAMTARTSSPVSPGIVPHWSGGLVFLPSQVYRAGRALLVMAGLLKATSTALSQAGCGGGCVPWFRPRERRAFWDVTIEEVPRGVVGARDAAGVRVGPPDRACRA